MQNISENYKKYFVFNENWKQFIKSFKNTIIYAIIEEILYEQYTTFSYINNKLNIAILLYFEKNIWSHREKWVKYYINYFFHFNNIIISRSENNYFWLKKILSKFVDNFYIIVKIINLILINLHEKYKQQFKND